MWTLTLLRVFYVASGVSQWVHVHSSWLYGACDAPQTKNDSLDFALLVTRHLSDKRYVTIAVAKRRAQHILKLCVINALV